MIRNQTRRQSPPRCIQSSLEFSVKRKCFVQIPLNQLIRQEKGVGDRKRSSSDNGNDNDIKNDEVVIYWPGVLVKDLVNFADLIRQKMEHLSSEEKEKYDFQLEKEILKAATSPSHSGVFLFGRIKFNTTNKRLQRRVSYMVPYDDYPITFSTDTNSIWGKVDVVDGYVEALQESLQFWALYSVRSVGNEDGTFYDQIVDNNYNLEDDVSIDSSTTSESDDDNDSNSSNSICSSEVGNVFGDKNVIRDNIVSPSRSCSDETSSMTIEMSQKQEEEGMMKIISTEPPPSSITEEKRRTQFDNILINRGDEAHKVDSNKEYVVSKKNTASTSQEQTNLSDSRSDDQEESGRKVNTQVYPENPDATREAQRLTEANAMKKIEEGKKINGTTHMVDAESKRKESTEVTTVAQVQAKAKVEQQAKEASETKMLVDLNGKRNQHIDAVEGGMDAKEVIEGKRKCIIEAVQSMNTKAEKEKVMLVDLDGKRNQHIDAAEGEMNTKEVIEGKRNCFIEATETMNTKKEKEKVILVDLNGKRNQHVDTVEEEINAKEATEGKRKCIFEAAQTMKTKAEKEKVILVDLDGKRNQHVDALEGEINAKELLEGKRKCIIEAALRRNTTAEKEKVIEAKAQINVQKEEIRGETQETQQQKLYISGDRVALVGFELQSNRQYNGKQGMVTSVVPFSSTANHLIYLSEFYDNENRNVVWYNILFANNDNRVIPSIHLRCVFNADYSRRVNDVSQNLDVEATIESKNYSRKTSGEPTESGTQKEYGKNITNQQIPYESTAVSKKLSRKAHIMETQNQNFRKGRSSTSGYIGKTITVNFSYKQLGLLIVDKSTLESANDADTGHGGLVVVSGYKTEGLPDNNKSYKKVNIGDELLSIGDTNVQKEPVKKIVSMISTSERPLQIKFVRRKSKNSNQEEAKKKIITMTEIPHIEATLKSKKPGQKSDSQVMNQSNRAAKATTEIEKPGRKRGRLTENKSSSTVPKSTHSKSNGENNVELECSINNKKQGNKVPGYWDEARKSKYRNQYRCSLHRKGVCWNCDCCWKCDHPPFCSKYLHRRKKLHKNIVAGATLDMSCKSIVSTNTKTSRKKRCHADISCSPPVGLDVSSSKKRKVATNEMQGSVSERHVNTNTPDKMKSKTKTDYSNGEKWLYNTYRYQVIEKIPTFTEVKKTLEEAGHIFRDGTYTAPLGRGKIQTFLSENDYRTFLCRDGVTLKGMNNRDASRERKYMTLMAWVCYHRVEKLLGQTVVPSHYTDKDIHSEWKQILTELGIHRSGGGKWTIPRVKGKVEDFTFTHRLAQEGIPEYLVEESNMSKYYHILLELHCSCPVRRFLYYPFFR